MPTETQPSVEMDNERVVFNHADGTRSVIEASKLAEDGQDMMLLQFAQLVVAQATAERMSVLANAVTQLSQALGGLAQANAERDPMALIDMVMDRFAKLPGFPGAPTSKQNGDAG